MAGYIGSKSSVVLNAGATAAQGALADTAVQPNDSVTLGAVTATSFSGDGSGLTNLPLSAPTTADVLSATAGASAGAVGTYVYGLTTSVVTSAAFGSTRAGSAILATTISQYQGSAYLVHSDAGTTLSGTWRLMGQTTTWAGNNANEEQVCLWLRIS